MSKEYNNLDLTIEHLKKEIKEMQSAKGFPSIKKRIYSYESAIKILNNANSESPSINENKAKRELCSFHRFCKKYTKDMSCSDNCGDYHTQAK